MIRRTLTARLRRAVQAGGTVLIEGPAGAGKTTLLRTEFPRIPYLSMQDAGNRSLARRDPAAFTGRLRVATIIDDIHLAPELAGHLAARSGRRTIILASSRRLSIPVTALRLYPPTLAELAGRQPVPLDMVGHFVPARPATVSKAVAWPGRPASIERDVRHLVQFRDLDRFWDFYEASFGASGQVLDAQSLARRAAVSRTTAVRWLAVLEACFLTIRIEPYDFGFGRRTMRSPKLHFLDSPVFESRVVSELYRNAVHSGAPPDLRYWRDSNGLEVPLVYQTPGAPPMPIYIAESPTVTDFSRLRRWMKLGGSTSAAMVSAQAPDGQRGPVLRYALDRL